MQNGFKNQYALAFTFVLALALGGSDALAQARGGGAGGRGGGGGGARGGGGGGARTTSGTYPSSTDIGVATITTDPETRKIIVVTDEDTNLELSKVVASLDRPKPQVLIKVVFLQVTHGDTLDLGVEGSYTHKIDDTHTGTVASDFGLQNAAAIAAGGGVYKLVSDDLTVVIRALATKGKTEILSRPSILARNSQQATITVGQSVPFITNSRTDNNGNLINTVTYSDIGIILRVTPFISSDGMVEMILAPEISSLSDQTVEIGSGIAAPVIDKRSADTVVVTPDGKTVAIGGLIAKQAISAVKKIPLLGDIPWAGAAFRRTVKSDIRTELLIFLTPYVVQRPGDLAKMTDIERSKLELAPKTFKEEQLQKLIDGLPERPATPPAATPPTSSQSSIPKKK